MIRRTLLLIFLSVVVAGCSTFSRRNQVNLLDPALSAYAGAIRWGNIDAAAGFARPRTGQVHGVNPKALDGLKVTGYKVRVNLINETADVANVSISFTYYHEDRVSIRQVEQDANWYYSSTEKAWYLDDNLPDFSR